MLLGFACSDAITFAVESKGKLDVSLTLIPPSPVTDKITLDIRGAVWNHKNEAKTYQASFILTGIFKKQNHFWNLGHKEQLYQSLKRISSLRFHIWRVFCEYWRC